MTEKKVKVVLFCSSNEIILISLLVFSVGCHWGFCVAKSESRSLFFYSVRGEYRGQCLHVYYLTLLIAVTLLFRNGQYESDLSTCCSQVN